MRFRRKAQACERAQDLAGADEEYSKHTVAETMNRSKQVLAYEKGRCREQTNENQRDEREGPQCPCRCVMVHLDSSDSSDSDF